MLVVGEVMGYMSFNLYSILDSVNSFWKIILVVIEVGFVLIRSIVLNW